MYEDDGEVAGRTAILSDPNVLGKDGFLSYKVTKRSCWEKRE